MHTTWVEELKFPYHIDWLDRNVALSAVPGRGEPFFGKSFSKDVDEALDLLVTSEGIGVVVTLMKQNELEQLEIGDLGLRVERRGMKWIHFQIHDGSVPRGNVSKLISRINLEIEVGGKVLIHCRGGFGRTGTVAGCYLASQGYKPHEILEKLHDARGSICPETPTQVKFILDYYRVQKEQHELHNI